MKPRSLLVVSFFIVVACKEAPKSINAVHGDPVSVLKSDSTATNLLVDTSASKIEWTGSKFGGSHNGEIKLNGGILSIKNDLPASGLFTINMESITNTDISDYDPIPKIKIVQYLKGKDFFNVEDFPVSKFEITSVVPEEGNKKIKLSGNLTLRGVSRNITFLADVEEETATVFRAHADFNIDRKEWGITHKGPKDEFIHNLVNLKLHLVAGKVL